MKYIFILFAFLLLQSCNKNKENTQVVITQNEEQNDTIAIDSIAKSDVKKDTLNEVLLMNDIKFNGKLNQFFSLSDFEKTFGKPDSTQLMSEEEPCSYIFENPDGSKDMNDKYLYKNGSRFENNKEKVAVDEFRFQNGNFIMYKGNRIDSKTTISDLKALFPNAIRNIQKLDVYQEGNLQYIQLREDASGISDGHIRIFFKNNSIYFLHWWFPC